MRPRLPTLHDVSPDIEAGSKLKAASARCTSSIKQSKMQARASPATADRSCPRRAAQPQVPPADAARLRGDKLVSNNRSYVNLLISSNLPQL